MPTKSAFRSERASGIKTYDEHLHYIHEIVKLKLWYLWNWLHWHPDEDFSHALKERVDIRTKVDVSGDASNPQTGRRDDTRWLSLVNQLADLYRKSWDKPDASAFEYEAHKLLRERINAISSKDYEAIPRLREDQYESLRYESPRKELFPGCPFPVPGSALLHIPVKLRQTSIFADRTYLAKCFVRIIECCDQEGIDKLWTETWLNSYPKWLKYFPQEWMDNMGPEIKDTLWHLGYWGQFLNARGAFNGKHARIMRETGEFPYWLRQSWCHVERLREHIQGILRRDSCYGDRQEG